MRILLIVEPERFDFYNYLSAIPDAEWFLLWHETVGQMKISRDKLPICFEEIFYWTQFSTPNELLKKINPDRIIFFEIIDLRQIALIVSARHNNIPTFYLEHGAAGDKNTAIERWKEITFKNHKLPYYWKRLTRGFWTMLKSKWFYYSVSSGFETNTSYVKYFSLPAKMLKAAPNKVLTYNHFKERVPHKCIVFNEVNYEEFALYTGASKEDSVFSGIPFFDKYYRLQTDEKNYIVYIDHPYYEENLIGWSKEHHDKISKLLFQFAEQNRIPLYIKLHPRSDKSLWDIGNYNKEFIRIVQYGDYTDLFLQAKLIIGFSSSLITGFLCAMKNTVLIGWHPKPHIFGSDFSKTGLCHISLFPDELTWKYEEWTSHNLTKENEKAYQDFLRQFNYPFDGKATERVINTIIHGQG